jgi:hypothetical protein
VADVEFRYSDLLPTGQDDTPYRLITTEGVSTFEANGRTFLQVDPEALRLLTAEAMHDIAHYLRPAHLKQLRKIIDDPDASGNDRFVAVPVVGVTGGGPRLRDVTVRDLPMARYLVCAQGAYVLDTAEDVAISVVHFPAEVARDAVKLLEDEIGPVLVTVEAALPVHRVRQGHRPTYPGQERVPRQFR